VERIFGSNEFQMDRFGPMLWLKDSSGYLTLEKSENFKEGKNIILNNLEGHKEIIISANNSSLQANPPLFA